MPIVAPARHGSFFRRKSLRDRHRSGCYSALAIAPAFFLPKNFPLRVRVVPCPAAASPRSLAEWRGGSFFPSHTQRRQLPRRTIMHRIMSRDRQADQVPQTIRILRIILSRPDMMDNLRILSPTVPRRLLASVPVTPKSLHAQMLPAFVFPRIVKHGRIKKPCRSHPTRGIDQHGLT